MFESKCYKDFVVFKISTYYGKLWCLSSILIWKSIKTAKSSFKTFVDILMIWYIQTEILPSPAFRTKKLFTKKLYLYRVKLSYIYPFWFWFARKCVYWNPLNQLICCKSSKIFFYLSCLNGKIRKVSKWFLASLN